MLMMPLQGPELHPAPARALLAILLPGHSGALFFGPFVPERPLRGCGLLAGPYPEGGGGCTFYISLGEGRG